MASISLGSLQIGELLLREGLINREDLDQALQQQKETGTRLGFALVTNGKLSEADLTRVLSQQYRVPAVELSETEIDAKILTAGRTLVAARDARSRWNHRGLAAAADEDRTALGSGDKLHGPQVVVLQVTGDVGPRNTGVYGPEYAAGHAEAGRKPAVLRRV